jgi:hypothetical protein
VIIVAYTTISNVCAELGITVASLTSSSIPSSTDVTAWINEAGAEIETYSGRVWASTVVPTTAFEVYDYSGDGVLLLEHRPVLSITQLLTNTAPLGSDASWVELTEGRGSTNSFELYNEQGMLRFHGNSNGTKPYAGSRTIKVAYSYGYSTTPLLVQRLATMIVAERYITTFSNASAGQLGGTISVGPISVSDSTSFSINRLVNIRQEKQRLFDLLGRVKTFSPYYDI